MMLPVRTTVDDINAVCTYLATKPTGATLSEAKAVMDKKYLEGRKLNALKFWQLIEYDGGKMKITDLGRRSVSRSGTSSNDAMREVIRQVPPYFSVMERAAHRDEETLPATEVAGHWYDHFRPDVSDSERILNDQAICFFQVAQGADLGTLTIGRRGRPTRFDFNLQTVRMFLELPSEGFLDEPDFIQKDAEESEVTQHDADEPDFIQKDAEESEVTDASSAFPSHEYSDRRNFTTTNRVFITHGKNHQILEQVKEIVTFGQREPVVAMEHETAAKPVPLKVMDKMRTCGAAVIHVDIESYLLDSEGNKVPKINENVLIEIGAAMALYGDRFVLLVEEGVSLPSNLQGLYECRYKGDELNMAATMKLLKAFNEF